MTEGDALEDARKAALRTLLCLGPGFALSCLGMIMLLWSSEGPLQSWEGVLGAPVPALPVPLWAGFALLAAGIVLLAAALVLGATEIALVRRWELLADLERQAAGRRGRPPEQAR